MVDEIKVNIIIPSGVYKKLNVDRVQIPAYEGGITILSKRAPSVFQITHGVVKSLDEDAKVLEQIFVSTGFAEFKNGVCNLMVEDAVSYADMTIDKALQVSNNAEDLTTKHFYDFIADYLSKETK